MSTKIRLSDADFLKSYLQLQSEGKTFQDLAVTSEMVPQSAYQRLNKLSKLLAKENVELPKMALRPKKAMDIKALKSIAAAYALGGRINEKIEQTSDKQSYVDA